jgi:ABC-type glycerol-3-phosphate transport system substrate-binding protein
MKKTYALGMIALLALMALVSCGKKEEKDSGHQTIEFWHSVSGGRGRLRKVVPGRATPGLD